VMQLEVAIDLQQWFDDPYLFSAYARSSFNALKTRNTKLQKAVFL